MASLLEDYMVPGAVPQINGMPDAQELERLKYLAIMRAGLGMAQREPMGKAVGAGINTYFEGEQNARRNSVAQAELALKQHQAMQQYREDMSKAMFLKSLSREQLQSMNLPDAAIDDIKTAKDPGAALRAYKNFFEPTVLSPGQTKLDYQGNMMATMPNAQGMVYPMQGGIPQQALAVPNAQELMARQAGMQKAAEQANTFQANVPGPNGPQSGYPQNIGAGLPPAMQEAQAAPAQAQRPPSMFNFSGKLSPQEVNAVLADQQNPRPDPNPITDKVIRGQNPVDVSATNKVNDLIATSLDKAKPEVQLAAKQTIPLIHDTRRMLESGKVVTGAGADVGLQVGRWLSQAGFKQADDYVANTQAFMNTQKRFVLTTIKSLGSGSGVSDQDRKYAAEIEGADIALNKDSILKLMEVSERMHRLAIAAHNETVDKAAQEGIPKTDFYKVDMPPEYKSAMPAAVSNATTTAYPNGPPVGTVIGGRRFKGGNPRDRANWE